MKKKDKACVKNTSKVYSLWSRIGKKVLAGVMGLGIAVGTVLGFVGCSNAQQTPTPPDPPGPSVNEVMTLDEFTSDYSSRAQEFVANFVDPVVTADKEVLSRDWLLNENSDHELDQVDIVYTYKVDEKKRAVEVASVSINNPLIIFDLAHADNIDNIMQDNGVTTSRSTAFEFDAKTNYQNQNILDALYTAAENEGETLKLFAEVDSLADTREFDLFSKGATSIDVTHVSVNVTDSSDEALLSSLADSSKVTVSQGATYDFSGTSIYSEGYTLETFNDGPTIDPETPPVEDEITDVELIESLEENCKDGILQKCLVGQTVNKDNITNGKWYIETDEDGNIAKVTYTSTYIRNIINYYFACGSITFDSPISKQDLKNGELNNATYKSEYVLGYNSTIQESRQDLTNAIFDALGIENTGAERIIIDNGSNTDSTLGMRSNEFKVVEITDNGIQEYVVRIKEADNDGAYAENLKTGSYWRLCESDSYELSGNILSQEEQTTNAEEAVDFDDDDLLFM